MKTIASFIAVVLLGIAFSASADSWIDPREETVASKGAAYLARIVPGKGETAARAVIYKLKDEKYLEVGRFPLRNRVRPVHAVITKLGVLLTFDNWYAAGYGS